MGIRTVLSRRSGRVGLVVAATTLVAAPASAWAAGAFSDIPSSGAWAQAIGYLAAHGITVGCNSTGTEFCPSQPVTRAEMAMFLYRMSGNDPTVPANIDAATLGGQTIAQLSGHRLLSGTAVPTVSVGDDGDFYLDTATHYLYGPKANGSWPAGVSLIGPQGSPGPAGPAGPAGATGATGPAGTTSWSGLLDIPTPIQALAAPSSCTAHQVATWTGSSWSCSSTPFYTHTILLHPGDSITDAINSVSGASPSNAWLIKLEPGVYSEQVTLKPYVDLEGSGQAVTVISRGGQSTAGDGTVIGASNSEVRDLTIRNTGGGGNQATAFAVTAGASPTLRDVTLDSSNATFDGYGIYASGTGNSILADNVQISVDGAGVRAYGAYADSSGKIQIRSGSVSVPTGSGGLSAFALFDGGGGTILTADVLIDGSTSGTATSLRCAGDYDASYAALTC